MSARRGTSPRSPEGPPGTKRKYAFLHTTPQTPPKHAARIVFSRLGRAQEPACGPSHENAFRDTPLANPVKTR